MAAELLDDLRRLVADSDKAGEGWTSDVCGRAIIEIERLKLLIRCEAIEPPSDVTDDCTTELAVELAQAKAEIERLTMAMETERGHREVDKHEAKTEITRLKEELLFVAAESEKQDDENERLRSELSQRNTDAKSTTLRPDTRADRV